MLLLGLSIVVLIAAPFFYWVANKSRGVLAALDGFIFVSIGGLAAFNILLGTIGEGGWLALAAAIIGLLGPEFLEKSLGQAAEKKHGIEKGHRVALALALIGLAVHAFLDGVALSYPALDNTTTQTLAWGVVVHRLPEGLTIWWLLAPSHGTKTAIGTLGSIALATVIGYFLSETIVLLSAGQELAIFQALVAGSLLHVVFHCPRPMVCHQGDRTTVISNGIGGLFAICFFFLMFAIDTHADHVVGEVNIGTAFVELIQQSAPALVLAYLAAGMLHTFLPRASIVWMGKGPSFFQSLRGVILGIPLPVCSCGVIPLYQSLIMRGAPAAAAMAFLIATPEIGIDAIFLSFPLLGGQMTVVRIVCAAIVAIFVGWLVGNFVVRKENRIEAGSEFVTSSETVMGRLKKGLHVGVCEVVDITGPWILFGLGIAALAADLLQSKWISNIPLGLDVPILALIGMPVYVCASGATPLVAVLMAKGISPGAALAFLLTGPATNVTTFGVLSRLHGRKTAFSFGILVAVFAIGLGCLVNLIIPQTSVFVIGHSDKDNYIGLIASICLGLLFVISFLRKGARQFVGQVFPLALRHDHDECENIEEHCCDSCCSESDPHRVKK